jgi:hypothetical protein
MNGKKETQDKVLELLKQTAHNDLNYAENFTVFINEAFNQTDEKFGAEKHIHDGTVIANVLWSYVAHKIKRFVVDDSQNLRLVKKNRSILLILNNSIGFRFKKGNKNGRTSNILTDSVKDFKFQKLSFESKSIISIDVIYVLNALETEIENIMFACPKSTNENHWKIEAGDIEKKNKSTLFNYTEDEIIDVKLDIKPELKKKQNTNGTE